MPNEKERRNLPAGFPPASASGDPHRIEIELVPNGEDVGRRRLHLQRRPGPADLGPGLLVEGPLEPEDRRSLSADVEQRRPLITAVIVGVTALAIGWVIGRSGASDDVAESGATASMAVDTTVAPRRPARLDAALSGPDVHLTLKDQLGAATASTTGPPIAVSVVDVDPRLAGEDITLVGLERSSVAVELDLAEQTLRRRDLGRTIAEPRSTIVGDGWITYADHVLGSSLVLHDDGTIDSVDFGDPRQPLWRRGTDRFWRPVDEGVFGPSSEYIEVDLNGEPTGVELELPGGARAWQADPKGGLVALIAGRAYSVSESSTEVIAPGELIGLSNDIAVSLDCDDRLRCGLVVTERATGTTRQLARAGSDESARILQSPFGSGGQNVGAISPDGSMAAAILVGADMPTLVLIDLRSGKLVELTSPSYHVSIGWSPDSRFAFFVDGFDGFDGFDDSGSGGVTAYDRQTGEAFPVLSEVLNWQAVAVKPV